MEQENQGIQKRKKGIETSGRILEIAADLFARKGYDGVPLREIALAANIRESSLYNHFANKQMILLTLFDKFAEMASLSRPSDTELENMLIIMEPEEVFKNIMFHVGSHISSILENTFMIIQQEKLKSEQAADAYFRYLVNEPTDYYEHLILKMMDRMMIKKVNARMIAGQYNYVSLSLTQEYFMAKNGIGDVEKVIKRMIQTLSFYCSLMKE
jgi:AcrR family transcriptional regulator